MSVETKARSKNFQKNCIKKCAGSRFRDPGTSFSLKYDLIFMDQSQLFLCIPLGKFFWVNVFALLVQLLAARLFLIDLLLQVLLLGQIF